MSQRAFKDGSGADMSIRLMVSAHLSTLDSFVHYYTPRRLLFRQDIHKPLNYEATGRYILHSSQCLMQNIIHCVFVHDRKDWNKQVKKRICYWIFQKKNLPRQSGPYIPAGQQTSIVSMQNHLNKSGYFFFLYMKDIHLQTKRTEIL